MQAFSTYSWDNFIGGFDCSMELLSKFGERLTELMFYANIKSEELGAKLNLSGETIRRYCKGMNGINLANLVKLADYFKCSIEFLACRTDKQLDFTIYPTPPFPKRLRVVLHEKGYTRYSLDKYTKFKDRYITNWDRGSQPNIFTLIELSDLLKCSIDYLVGRER